MTTEIATFVVPMAPRAKGRPRFARGHAYTPAETRDFEHAFAFHANPHKPREPLDGAVRVDILAVFERTKRLNHKSAPSGFVRHTVKPDKDNVEKAVLDALKGWWLDDAQVCTGETVKVYAERGGLPRTVVRVSTADEDADEEAAALGLACP